MNYGYEKNILGPLSLTCSVHEVVKSKPNLQGDLSKSLDTQFSISPKKGFAECYFGDASVRVLIDLLRALREDLKVTTEQIIICLNQRFSNFKAHKPHLVGLLQCRFLDLISRDFDSVCPGQGPKSCILKKVFG